MGSVQHCQASHYIRRVRHLLGWTQFDLSEATGIDRSKLSLAENARLELPPAEMRLIYEAFTLGFRERSVEVSDLLRRCGCALPAVESLRVE
jgi:transcriptional regulator with XRE-family HTH domain